MKKIKALALLSGGLDSTLAAKLILEQGIEVTAMNVVTPFCLCGKGGCGAAGVAKKLDIPLKIISAGKDYLKIVRQPKHGYGRNMNPCIDCRIFILKKAKKYAREIGASFIFTGEVLGERPMSQHWKALMTIEEEAGLKGQVLRPLSARLLPETRAEKEGLVDRKRLLSIRGRSRKPQMELAEKFTLTDYPCPAGGCLLTYREYANKLRDLFTHKKRVSFEDIALLKLGRHFRHLTNKIIVGRNEAENKTLLQRKSENDYCFEVVSCGSPITLLQGPKTARAIREAAALTAYHSDEKSGKVTIRFGRKLDDNTLTVSLPEKTHVDSLRIV